MKADRIDHDQKSLPNREAPLSSSLSDTIAVLRSNIGYSSDFIIRELGEAVSCNSLMAISYIEGMVDQEQLSELMEALIAQSSNSADFLTNPVQNLEQHLPIGGIRYVTTLESLLQAILGGEAVVLIDGVNGAIAVTISGGVRRSVEEPTSQTVIRGPKEGFTEDISTNITLLRRKLQTPDFRINSRLIGRYTQTKVSVVYIQGLANPEVLDEMFKRLDSIEIDGVLESGYIEEFIQDKMFTPFPTLINTERPDAVAGNLLEGQVAVLVDGTPFVLIAPVTFFKFFQSSEDYYQRYDIASFLRIIRLFSFIIALLLPSMYIAVTTFQQEMLPTTLLISLAAQREGTPLPALLEALLMEVTFEVIREAGVRMPRVIGPAISIVGALVLGQAAVQAGLVSGAMVIVVSFTAIASFVMPNINLSSAVRLVRFLLMLLAGMFGIFGILAGIVPLLVHLISMSSFGVPYMTPLAPLRLSNLKDTFIRVPWRAMKTRPSSISVQNRVRQNSVKEETAKKQDSTE
ncbi:spore gernimation protein KA [Paenibacillus sp. Soil766]|uniref:spore germination protein n=1 Tax=Paenibacillus sp. Soil766 TaxID=1736404 RepID=UPI00070D0218|nr:spore germination protein [Paenibacillus sp. Soil766]KRE92194.1 spore gernimation protein KA [Paenibacillus sp. Soil766]